MKPTDPRILGWHNGRPVFRISGAADPPAPPVVPPDTSMPDTLAAPDAPAPAPAPAVRRTVSRAAPVAPPTAQTISRDDALAALGMDSDSWERLEKQHQEWEAKRPEIERVRQEHKRLGATLQERETALAQQKRLVAEMAEANFALHLRGFTSDLSREIGLVPDATAAKDLYMLIDRHCHTAGEGDARTMVFREGTFEVDLADPEARKKIGEHLVKSRPYLVASRLAQGGGGAGRPATVVNRNEPPKDRAEFLQKLGMQVMQGGRAAGGR